MKQIKILHCADIHFDTPFKDVGEVQSKINKEEIKEVFHNILTTAKEKSVDILLLAGDIFDNLTISKETLYFIESSLNRIKDIRVFISPGNHDPYGNNSFYKLIDWPENVYIFKDKIEKVYIEELDVNVWGGGFTENYIRSSMLNGIEASDDKINLMVLHGEISNSKDGNEYNPITLNEIGNSNMDYIALGHRHKFSGIKKENNTYYAYSGCPQGRGFDELGKKGVILGTVAKGYADLKFIDICKRTYEEVKVDVTDAFGYEEVKLKVIDSILEDDRKRNLYKIILVGEISEEFNIDEAVITDKLKDLFYFCKVIDKTSVKINIEEISKGYSVKSLFVKKLKEKLDNAKSEEEKEVILMALKIGLASLSDEEVKVDDC